MWQQCKGKCTGQYMIGWVVTKETLQSFGERMVSLINGAKATAFSCRKINVAPT